MRKIPLIYVLIPIIFLWWAGEFRPEQTSGGQVPGKSPLASEIAFSFAILGDVPYSPRQEKEFLALIQELNHESLAFVVHVGDLKGGGSLCDDGFYSNRYQTVQTSSHPFILIPGDNDWTDCHRPSNGGFHPEERLALLRKVFFSDRKSLGETPILLDRQSQGVRHKEFVENVRWRLGSVLFIGLHVVGSNNNLGRTSKADAEYHRRTQANLTWLRESFQLARENECRGVVIFIHGNPFEPVPEIPGNSGFREFLEDLELEVKNYNRPVTLVHGDTHYFRIDKPLPRSPEKPRLMSFTRVESFGSPNVQWIRGRVDPYAPNLVTFESGAFSQLTK